MTMKSGLAAAVAACLTLPSLALAQGSNGSSRGELVVDAAWLGQHLHDPDLVLLQVGLRETYDKQHIPGARFGDWMQLHTMDMTPGALTLEMPPATSLHDASTSLGISDRSRIVVYPATTTGRRRRA